MFDFLSPPKQKYVDVSDHTVSDHYNLIITNDEIQHAWELYSARVFEAAEFIRTLPSLETYLKDKDERDEELDQQVTDFSLDLSMAVKMFILMTRHHNHLLIAESAIRIAKNENYKLSDEDKISWLCELVNIDPDDSPNRGLYMHYLRVIEHWAVSSDADNRPSLLDYLLGLKLPVSLLPLHHPKLESKMRAENAAHATAQALKEAMLNGEEADPKKAH